MRAGLEALILLVGGRGRCGGEGMGSRCVQGQNAVLLKQIDHLSQPNVIHRIKLSSYILVPGGQFTDNSLSSAGL